MATASPLWRWGSERFLPDAPVESFLSAGARGLVQERCFLLAKKPNEQYGEGGVIGRRPAAAGLVLLRFQPKLPVFLPLRVEGWKQS